MKILISAPNYTHQSGGIRVLHYLGYLSHLNGHNVKMSCEQLNKSWGEYSQDIDRPDITIIPEIDPPSDSNQGPVVRWVLYFPSVLCNGPSSYPSHELVVSYHDEYDIAALKAATRKPILKFNLPYCDMSEMPTNNIPVGLRDIKRVVWYGKGDRIATPEQLGAIEISRTWPQSRKELLKILKQTNTFYSFDKNTALNDEALICGCDVMLWKDGRFERYINPIADSIVMNSERDVISVNYFLNNLRSLIESNYYIHNYNAPKCCHN